MAETRNRSNGDADSKSLGERDVAVADLVAVGADAEAWPLARRIIDSSEGDQGSKPESLPNWTA